MNKPSFTAVLVTAFLMPVTNATAWSDDAPSNVERQQLPTSRPAPVHYPPPPNPGWQAAPWGSPPAWAVPPRGYRQPSPEYRADLEFIRLQEELAANQAELDKARRDLQQGEVAIQEVRAELDRALNEHHRNLDLQHALSEKLAAAAADNVVLQSQVAQLTIELTAANESLVDRDRQQVAALKDERDQLQNARATHDEQLATLKDELQVANTGLQQARSGMDASRQELAESQAQVQTYKNRLDDLNARLEDQKQAMLHARQLMAEIISARDSLRADLSASTEELTRVHATLMKTQEQAEQLRQARADSLIAASPEQPEPVPGSQPVPAESNASVPPVEVAAMESSDIIAQAVAEELPAAVEGKPVIVASVTTTTPAGAADADRDGVPDSIDLCPGTAEAVAVKFTGCVANAAIPLTDVNFRYNSIELTDDARLTLDRIAGILGKQADIRLEVAGHTDSQGNEAYNLWLSQHRAQAVRDYLITHGLDPDNVSARGYGAQQPIADNSTVDGLVQNRRVELRNLP